MLGEFRQLIGGDTQPFGGVFADLGDHLVVEESNNLFEIFFNARDGLVQGLIHFSA
jgi:hypothetical protein